MILIFEFLSLVISLAFVGWVIWFVFNFVGRKSRNRREFDESENEQLEELTRLAESMAERIKNLETILDAEQPDWREYDEKNQT